MLRYTAGKLSVEYGEDHLLRIAFDGKLLLYADDLFRLEWREGDKKHALTAHDMQVTVNTDACGLSLCFECGRMRSCRTALSPACTIPCCTMSARLRIPLKRIAWWCRGRTDLWCAIPPKT